MGLIHNKLGLGDELYITFNIHWFHQLWKMKLFGHLFGRFGHRLLVCGAFLTAELICFFLHDDFIILVAAESFDPEKDNEEDNEPYVRILRIFWSKLLHFFLQVVHPKSDSQRDRLAKAVSGILVFRSLDEVSLFSKLYLTVFLLFFIGTKRNRTRCHV